MRGITIGWAAAKVCYFILANYDRALRASEDSVVRATLGWCSGQLGMPEAALAHYRRACERNRRADLLLGLMAAEHHAGNVAECGAVLEQLRARRAELSHDELNELERLERMLSEALPRK